jgi:GDP-mannose 6-dehydrogenase
VGANKSFLERELPHIASLMRLSVEDVVAESEVVVIANGDKAFRSVPDLLSPKQCMIDLVGVCNGAGKPAAKYEGICW